MNADGNRLRQRVAVPARKFRIPEFEGAEAEQVRTGNVDAAIGEAPAELDVFEAEEGAVAQPPGGVNGVVRNFGAGGAQGRTMASTVRE